jgi:maltose alpha-D-glucosyltransferase/alpha-amylase
MARTVQPVEIPLRDFAGLTPVEMLGRTEFPRIGEPPYFLTLAPYGFYWFQLREVVTPITARTATPPEEPVSVPALFAGVVWDSLLDGSMREIIEKHALVPFLERQRWFGGKARRLVRTRFVDWATLRGGAHPAFLTIVETDYADGTHERYLLPLAMSSEREARALEETYPQALVARITGARKGALYDGLSDEGTCQTLLASMQEERTLPMRRGVVQADNVDLTPQRAPADTLTPVTRSPSDQSNTSVLFGKRLILKLFRRVEPGPNPDVEIGEYLTEQKFGRVPPLMGSISYLPGPQGGRVLSDQPDLPASIAMLQEYVWNQGNAWQVTIDELGRYLERVGAQPMPTDAGSDEANEWAFGRLAEPPASVTEAISAYLATAEILGRRTGELHVALAANIANPAFASQPMSKEDLKTTIDGMRHRAEEHLNLLEAVLPQLDDRMHDAARQVLELRDALLQQFDDLRGLTAPPTRIRCHGDYHLGQVLVTEGDVVIIDFEGEPARPMAQRRAKSSPLRDVAGMLRSFSYAALTAIGAATETRPDDAKRLAPWADLWQTWVSATFLRAYLAATHHAEFLPPPGDFDVLLRAYVLEKALYELAYELNNRPAWVHIPLTGIAQLRLKTNIDRGADLTRSASHQVPSN